MLDISISIDGDIVLKNSKYSSSLISLLSSLVTGASYVLQASLGLIVTIGLFLLNMYDIIPGAGVILALGFGQGTGQALNYGKLYETDFGFVGGATFGLTIATIGFIVASVVGVTYMNILRKKGKLKIATEKEKQEKETLEDYVQENEIPNTESVDKLTVNFALILVVYAIVYAIMKLVNVNLIWGFNFLLGTILATLFRKGFVVLKKMKLRN